MAPEGRAFASIRPGQRRMRLLTESSTITPIGVGPSNGLFVHSCIGGGNCGVVGESHSVLDSKGSGRGGQLRAWHPFISGKHYRDSTFNDGANYNAIWILNYTFKFHGINLYLTA